MLLEHVDCLYLWLMLATFGSLVLFYDCEHYPVNIIHTCCSLLLTLNRFPSAPEGSTWYMQIQCNTGTYSQTFASAVQLWNTALDICQLPPYSFRTHLSSLRLLSTGVRPGFFHLHCSVIIRSYCSLFAARLSRHMCLINCVCDIAQMWVGTVIGRWNGCVRVCVWVSDGGILCWR